MSYCNDTSNSTIIAKLTVSANPCPMTTQSTHNIHIQTLSGRQIYGNLTCRTGSKGCRFTDLKTRKQVDRCTLIGVTTGPYQIALTRSPNMKNIDEIITVLKYRDTTEKPPRLPHTERCRYLIALL